MSQTYFWLHLGISQNYILTVYTLLFKKGYKQNNILIKPHFCPFASCSHYIYMTNSCQKNLINVKIFIKYLLSITYIKNSVPKKIHKHWNLSDSVRFHSVFVHSYIKNFIFGISLKHLNFKNSLKKFKKLAMTKDWNNL